MKWNGIKLVFRLKWAFGYQLKFFDWNQKDRLFNNKRMCLPISVSSFKEIATENHLKIQYCKNRAAAISARLWSNSLQILSELQCLLYSLF